MRRRLLIVGVSVALVGLALVSGAGGTTAAGNLAAAHAEAARLLTLLELPGGAQPSVSEPAGDHGALAVPSYDALTPNLVDTHAWRTVPGTSSDVLAYVEAHMPAGARRETSTIGGDAQGFAAAGFTLPPISGVLSQRALGVTVVQLNGAITGVRTDGETVWIVPRPAWEQIPSDVRRVTFTASAETPSGRSGPVSVSRTLTGASANRLVAFVNGLELVQPGFRSCPFGSSDRVSLRFYAPDGGIVARADENPTGCAYVSLRIGDRTGPNLNDYPSVTEELERLGAIPECSHPQLRSAPPAELPSGLTISFTFTNQSDSVCRLSGFPRIVFLDANGHTLPTRTIDQYAALIRPLGLSAAVALDPAQAASFDVSFSDCATPDASSVSIRLPGLSRPFDLRIGTPLQPLAPCHGRLVVTSFSPSFP